MLDLYVQSRDQVLVLGERQCGKTAIAWYFVWQLASGWWVTAPVQSLTDLALTDAVIDSPCLGHLGDCLVAFWNTEVDYIEKDYYELEDKQKEILQQDGHRLTVGEVFITTVWLHHGSYGLSQLSPCHPSMEISMTMAIHPDFSHSGIEWDALHKWSILPGRFGLE